VTRAQRLVLILFFAATALAAVAPIRNYDFFWHLATGRWIVEHSALPASDPFGVASSRDAWINGEWLFQLGAYGLHEAFGLRGLSIVRALLAACIFSLVYLRSGRSLLVTAVAFAGAMQTFDFRPSGVALLFIPLAITARSPVAQAILSAIWINVHPSALLAPGIAALSTRRVLPAIASAAGLLLNPYGWKAIAAPLHLMAFVGGGEFVNAEWLPSNPRQFPLLYLCVIGGAILLFVKREAWWRVLLFAAFAWLAMRHVRHQGLFFAALPLLVLRFEIRRSIAFVASAAAIVLAALSSGHTLGVPEGRFPVAAVERLRATGFKGHIYNPDQFGGYLIWSFYPERRTLTDGRNELYATYIREYGVARLDQRAWRALLAKYRIDLAVDEYRPPLEVVNAVTREVQHLPASLAYWPRREWALIGFDEAGMVFARRAAFERSAIEKWEIRDEVPDALQRR
jgi:hypothetical protein